MGRFPSTTRRMVRPHSLAHAQLSAHAETDRCHMLRCSSPRVPNRSPRNPQVGSHNRGTCTLHNKGNWVVVVSPLARYCMGRPLWWDLNTIVQRLRPPGLFCGCAPECRHKSMSRHPTRSNLRRSNLGRDCKTFPHCMFSSPETYRQLAFRTQCFSLLHHDHAKSHHHRKTTNTFPKETNPPIRHPRMPSKTAYCMVRPRSYRTLGTAFPGRQPAARYPGRAFSNHHRKSRSTRSTLTNRPTCNLDAGKSECTTSSLSRARHMARRIDCLSSLCTVHGGKVHCNRP